MTELFQTFLEVERRLTNTLDSVYEGPIQATPTSIGKWTLETHVCIHPLKRTRDIMNDADRKTCLDAMLKLLEGTHFIFKKSYDRDYESIYYVKPDWSYWRGR